MRASLLAAVALAILGGALCAGCEVSFFGNEPITMGMSGLAQGSEAQACGEPDDARRARESERECAEHCRIEDGVLAPDCEIITLGEDGIATLDVGQVDGLVMRMEICDPHETVLEIADARDPETSSHDASILLNGTTLSVRASEGSGAEASSIGGWIAETGCSTRTIVLSEQIVYFAETERGLCGTGLLRISPPVDDEGTPDALWFLALTGSVDRSAHGTGLRSLDICAW